MLSVFYPPSHVAGPRKWLLKTPQVSPSLGHYQQIINRWPRLEPAASVLSGGRVPDEGQVTRSPVQPFGEHFLIPRDVWILSSLEMEPGVHICSLSTQEADAEGSQQPGSQPGLSSKY